MDGSTLPKDKKVNTRLPNKPNVAKKHKKKKTDGGGALPDDITDSQVDVIIE